jgi:LytTr DNA-binding domain
MTQRQVLFFLCHFVIWSIYMGVSLVRLDKHSKPPPAFPMQRDSSFMGDRGHKPPPKPFFAFLESFLGVEQGKKPPPPDHFSKQHDSTLHHGHAHQPPPPPHGGKPRDVHPFMQIIADTLFLMIFAYLNVFWLLPKFLWGGTLKLPYWAALGGCFIIFMVFFLQLKRFSIDALRHDVAVEFAYSAVYIFELAIKSLFIIGLIFFLRLIEIRFFSQLETSVLTKKSEKINIIEENEPPIPPLSIETENEPLPMSEPFLFVKEGTNLVKVEWADIRYIEGMKDYVKIHTTEGKVVALHRMKHLEEQLPSDQFVRIHKSYIVALAAITSVQRDKISIGTVELPVSDTYRKVFKTALERLKSTN